MPEPPLSTADSVTVSGPPDQLEHAAGLQAMEVVGAVVSGPGAGGGVPMTAPTVLTVVPVAVLCCCSQSRNAVKVDTVIELVLVHWLSQMPWKVRMIQPPPLFSALTIQDCMSASVVLVVTPSGVRNW